MANLTINNFPTNTKITNTITKQQLTIIKHIDEGCALVHDLKGSFYIDGQTPAREGWRSYNGRPY